MSELIQESKYITVQEFMPQWTDLKEKFGDNPIERSASAGKGLDISKGDRCMIGEAHGFEGAPHYGGCKKCHFTSYGISMLKESTAINASYGTLKDFYKFKETLYNHFMEKHPEKLLRSGI